MQRKECTCLLGGLSGTYVIFSDRFQGASNKAMPKAANFQYGRSRCRVHRKGMQRTRTHLRPFLEAVKSHAALRQHLAGNEPGLAAADDAHALLAFCCRRQRLQGIVSDEFCDAHQNAGPANVWLAHAACIHTLPAHLLICSQLDWELPAPSKHVSHSFHRTHGCPLQLTCSYHY